MYRSPIWNNQEAMGKLYDPESRQVVMGIYNNILLAAGEMPYKNLLVCLPNPREGASTVALGGPTKIISATWSPLRCHALAIWFSSLLYGRIKDFLIRKSGLHLIVSSIDRTHNHEQ